MRVIAWDIETHPISPERPAPPIVCGSFAGGFDTLDRVTETTAGLPDPTEILWDFTSREGVWACLVRGPDAVRHMLKWSTTIADVTVGHNVAFDWSCVINTFPGMRRPHAMLLDDGAIADTLVREMLLGIARGRLARKNSLAHCVKRHFGVEVEGKSGPDAWRLRYAELEDVPLADWPAAATEYSLLDSIWTYALYQSQGASLAINDWKVVDGDGRVTNENAQTWAAYVLRDMAMHGPRTDPSAVDAFEKSTREIVTKADEVARAGGFLRVNRCKACGETGISDSGGVCPVCFGLDHESARLAGIYKLKAPPKGRIVLPRLRARVSNAYGGCPPETDKGAVSTATDTLLGSGDPLLTAYAEGSFATKLLSTYLPILRQGQHTPILSRPNVLVRSGRTSWAQPNFQNPPKKGGFRECFLPGPGRVYASVDYSAHEMGTLAQVCLDWFNESRLADAINAGVDPHLLFAAEQLLGIPYGDAKVRLTSGDSEVKSARSRAKVANFGFPGGMGAKSFMEYARGYGFEFSYNEARDLREAWLRQWPMVAKYLDQISGWSDGDLGDGFPIRQVRSKRVRGGCFYTSAANSFFQGLAADGMKAAMVALYKAMRLEETELFAGVDAWVMIHDEILFEGPENTAHVWAERAAEIMVSVMEPWTPGVAVRAEPALMRRWTKAADTMRDAHGILRVWEPKAAN